MSPAVTSLDHTELGRLTLPGLLHAGLGAAASPEPSPPLPAPAACLVCFSQLPSDTSDMESQSEPFLFHLRSPDSPTTFSVAIIIFFQ